MSTEHYVIKPYADSKNLICFSFENIGALIITDVTSTGSKASVKIPLETLKTDLKCYLQKKDYTASYVDCKIDKNSIQVELKIPSSGLWKLYMSDGTFDDCYNVTVIVAEKPLSFSDIETLITIELLEKKWLKTETSSMPISVENILLEKFKSEEKARIYQGFFDIMIYLCNAQNLKTKDKLEVRHQNPMAVQHFNNFWATVSCDAVIVEHLFRLFFGYKNLILKTLKAWSLGEIDFLSHTDAKKIMMDKAEDTFICFYPETEKSTNQELIDCFHRFNGLRFECFDSVKSEPLSEVRLHAVKFYKSNPKMKLQHLTFIFEPKDYKLLCKDDNNNDMLVFFGAESIYPISVSQKHSLEPSQKMEIDEQPASKKTKPSQAPNSSVNNNNSIPSKPS